MNLQKDFAANVRDVLVCARGRAVGCDRYVVEVTDLVRSLLLDGYETGFKRCLATLGVDLQAVANEIPALTTGSVKDGIKLESIPLSPQVIKVLILAAEEANTLGSRLCNTGHVLLGILRVVDSTDPVAIALKSRGVTLYRVRDVVGISYKS